MIEVDQSYILAAQQFEHGSYPGAACEEPACPEGADEHYHLTDYAVDPPAAHVYHPLREANAWRPCAGCPRLAAPHFHDVWHDTLTLGAVLQRVHGVTLPGLP